MPTSYTVGHGARPLETFIAILQQASIEVLVDVRRYPGSRRHPHFSRPALAESLSAAGIRYEWWGAELGGRRAADERSFARHRGWENEAFRAYAAHMDTADFREGLYKLMELSSNQSTAIMCAETLWWRCHRRLIADALVVAGCDVVHLGSNGPQSHQLTAFARVDERGLIAYDGVLP